MDKNLIKFTNGHVQLNWEKGSWIVRDWNAIETHHPTRIQPEENLLSALIRPPSRPESIDPEPNPVTESNIQEQTTVRQEWPHPNTATMIDRVLTKDGMEDPLPTKTALDKHAMEDGH